MRRSFTSLLIAVAVLSPVALVASPASAAKSGQLCKAADEGKSQDGLKCTKDGTRFRWEGGAAATKAPTTKKATGTTKKSSGTTKKSSTASAGGGVAVNGRFCAAADKGRKETDSKGRRLTCKADANGKNRWQE
jgi:hypothetical protein